MNEILERVLKQLPGFKAAEQAVQQEALSHRAALIEQVREHRRSADSTESQLAADASVLNTKAAKLREQLGAVECGIAENLSARSAARFQADAAITQLQRELRSEVHEPLANLQARIVQTRQLLQSNFGNVRPWILGANNERPHTDEQVVSALALLLCEYRGIDRLALEEADFQMAIAAIPERLAKAGIQLIDSNTLLHLVPPLQKAQAYI